MRPAHLGSPLAAGLRSTAGLVAGAGLLAVAGLLAAAGCDTLDNTQRVADRSDLVNDLANRLDRVDELTYTADYQLAGGATATIAQAQHPSRAAFTYPGGKLIFWSPAVTGQSAAPIVPQVSDCRTSGSATTCTISDLGSPGSSPGPEPTAAFQATLGSHGMIAPATVVALLNATALDADATVSQRDTTIAGQHATCVRAEDVDNAPASTFEVCATTDGVIGSFTGVVNGNQVEIAMTQYRGNVSNDAFDRPPGAKTVRK